MAAFRVKDTGSFATCELDKRGRISLCSTARSKFEESASDGIKESKGSVCSSTALASFTFSSSSFSTFFLYFTPATSDCLLGQGGETAKSTHCGCTCRV